MKTERMRNPAASRVVAGVLDMKGQGLGLRSDTKGEASDSADCKRNYVSPNAEGKTSWDSRDDL